MKEKEIDLKDAGPIHCEACDIYFTAATHSQELMDAAEHFETLHKMSVKRDWKNSQELESISIENCSYTIT